MKTHLLIAMMGCLVMGCSSQAPLVTDPAKKADMLRRQAEYDREYAQAVGVTRITCYSGERVLLDEYTVSRPLRGKLPNSYRFDQYLTGKTFETNGECVIEEGLPPPVESGSQSSV